MKKTYQGSCHCGAVRFEAHVDLSEPTTRCNCSFCGKARLWFTFVKANDFRLLSGDALSDYQRTPPGKSGPFLHFEFCSRCGMRPFTRGGSLPQFGGPFYAINIACLDGLSDAERAKIPVKYADGRHDDWQATPAETRHL